MTAAMPRKSYGDTDFITGMRAFAVLAVVLIHTGGAGLRSLGPLGNEIADWGRTGVYVFFVISGFSVASSYEKSTGYADYLNKRLWRIAPLYYFWLGAATIPGKIASFWSGGGLSVDIYNFVMHALFLGFFDYRVTNSVLGVEWSIPIEVFWYFWVPVLLVFSTTHRRAALLALAGLVVYLLSVRYPEILPVDKSKAALAMHWTPIPYFFSYALGILAYKTRGRVTLRKGWTGLKGFAVLVAMVGLFYVIQPYLRRIEFLGYVIDDGYLQVSLLTAGIIVWARNEHPACRWILNNRIVQHIGAVSYGIYLCHVLVFKYLLSSPRIFPENPTVRFGLVVIVSTALSTLTYMAFEQRLISFGKNLSKRGGRLGQGVKPAPEAVGK